MLSPCAMVYMMIVNIYTYIYIYIYIPLTQQQKRTPSHTFFLMTITDWNQWGGGGDFPNFFDTRDKIM